MTALSRIALLLISGMLFASAATAHPHVWVVVKDKVVIDKEQIAGVEHEWVFDEIYSTTAVEGLDKNGDGKYTREELQELAQTNIDGLKDFENFTFGDVSGTKVAFGKPQDYWLEHANNVLILHFYLPLAKPLPIATKHFRVTVLDPSYFIGFDFDNKAPFSMSEGAPADCKATIVQEEEDADQAALNQAFSAQVGPMASTGGGGVSNTFEVQCGKS